MKVTFSVLLLLILLSSYDCYQVVSGHVVDPITKEPIQGAEIFTRRFHRSEYSDSLGFFTLHEISEGFFGCHSLEVRIKKVGYMEQRVSISSGETKPIELKRRE